MPKLYVRATALSNVCGRINYISSHKKQEFLLASYDGAAELMNGQFWMQLAKESQAAFEQSGKKTRVVRDKKTGEEKEINLKCCQGREIMIPLSNSLLDRMSADEIAKTVSDEFKEKLGLETVVAVHQKSKAKQKNNLHVHVIFPERELLAQPTMKIAERNLFFDAEGKRRYKKSEIMDENKNLLPGCRIVKKGEVYETRYFSAANEKYHQNQWLKKVKTDVILNLRNGKLRGDVEIKEFDRGAGEIPQQHIGKNVENGAPEIAEKIKTYNEDVKQFNQLVEEGIILKETALKVQKKESRVKENKGQALRGFINKIIEYYQNARKQIKAPAEPEQDKKESLDERIFGAGKRSAEQTATTKEQEKSVIYSVDDPTRR